MQITCSWVFANHYLVYYHNVEAGCLIPPSWMSRLIHPGILDESILISWMKPSILLEWMTSSRNPGWQHPGILSGWLWWSYLDWLSSHFVNRSGVENVRNLYIDRIIPFSGQLTLQCIQAAPNVRRSNMAGVPEVCGLTDLWPVYPRPPVCGRGLLLDAWPEQLNPKLSCHGSSFLWCTVPGNLLNCGPAPPPPAGSGTHQNLDSKHILFR